MTSKNIRAHFLYYIKLCASYQILRWYQTEVTVRKRTIRFKIGDFVVPCDLEIWWMTLENNSVPLLYFIKFVHHLKTMVEFKLELQSRNAQLGSKSAFFSRVTLKFDGWPWKTIGHLFYTISSFVHHFKAMGEFKLEFQSGNAQFGSKSAFLSRLTLKFDGWPWKTIGHHFNVASSCVHPFIAISEFKLELQSGNAMWPWNLTDDLEKQLSATQCIISSSYVNSNRSYGPETA